MQKNNFYPYVHLHTHSKYSLKDGIPSPEDYAKRVDEMATKYNSKEMRALALTEHGNLYSFVKHYLACKEYNVKPIIGYEAYHCESYGNVIDKNTKRYHLLLLAKNQTGLKNLFKIATYAGFHKYKGPQKNFSICDEQIFKKHGKGIIACSACLGGIIPLLILDGKINEAIQKIQLYNSYFDEFYLEVQPHEIKEQIKLNKILVSISKKTNIPLVITDDAHYLDKEDKDSHDILKKLDHMNGFETINNFKSCDEVYKYCIKYNIPLSAIENTVKIANNCNTDILPKNPTGLMPKFSCPKGYNENSYLRKLTMEGLIKKSIKNKFNDFNTRKKRLLYELDVICRKKYAGYFLILWDWFKNCSENKILLGNGRGSAAGSETSYLLDITGVDPIKNNLLFERFLSMLRDEAPDKHCCFNLPFAIYYI